MHLATYLLNYLVTALVAGIGGGLAMEAVMGLVRRFAGTRGDMLLALGSLLTRSRDQAHRVGLVVHATVAIGFGLVYTLLLIMVGYTRLPLSVVVGLSAGTLHGILVSLMLVWVISDHHPLEEFREADLLVGFSHFLAHAAYGATVGLVVGLSPLL